MSHVFVKSRLHAKWWSLPVLAAVASAAGLLTSAASPSSVAASGPSAVSIPFSGSPATPQPFSDAHWDVLVHNRDIDTYFEPFQAQHGADCGPYPATHTVSSFADAVFLCHNHVMTAISSQGYAAAVLTPDKMADWSSGTAVIKWHQSTLRTSLRDWTDVWVTPFGDNLMAPTEDGLPDLQGPARNAVHIEMGDYNGETTFGGDVYDNFVGTDITTDPSTSIESVLTPSAIGRATFELDLSANHVRFGMPDYGVWWVDQDVNVGFTRGVVQLGHHSYTPEKDPCAPAGSSTCAPDTWHWSDFSISSALPFQMVHSSPYYVNQDTAGVVTLDAPAPANAYLRFHGEGDLMVSFDGGTTFAPAQLQAQEGGSVDPAHFASFWMPIPAGTRTVVFSSADGQDWGVRDVGAWAS